MHAASSFSFGRNSYGKQFVLLSFWVDVSYYRPSELNNTMVNNDERNNDAYHR
jgi:hypothetical protein